MKSRSRLCEMSEKILKKYYTDERVAIIKLQEAYNNNSSQKAFNIH